LFQISSGNLAETWGDSLFRSDDPFAKVSEFTKVTFGGKGPLEATLLLSSLTNKKLPDITGELGTVQVLFTTQQLQGGVLPGIYFAVASSSNFFVAILRWAMNKIADILKKISFGALNIKDKIDSVLDKMEERAGSSLQFWFNTDNFGFKTKFPVLISLLGTVEVECKVTFQSVQIDCSAVYDAPKFISALWDGAKKVIGAVADTMKSAFNFAKDKLAGVGKAIVQVASAVGKEVSKTAKTVGKALSKTFSARRRRRRDSRRRRRRRRRRRAIR